MFFRGKMTKKACADIRKEDRALPAKQPLRRKSQGRTSSDRSLKAGMTVEAACILPFFLWAVLGAFYFIELTLVQTKLVGGIRDTSRRMALLAYGVYNAEETSGVEKILEGALSIAYARSEILEKAELEETALGEEVSVILAGSDFSDEEIIDLRVTSSVRIPIPLYNVRPLRFTERGRVRAWTGRSPHTEGEEQEEIEDTEMVYVTATGSVYHRDSSCTYIRVAVQTASIHSMDSRRNDSGGKYYPCSCYQEHASGTVYYTKHGTRYHSSQSCSSLKRTVRKVALSSLKGVKPCSKCG